VLAAIAEDEDLSAKLAPKALVQRLDKFDEDLSQVKAVVGLLRSVVDDLNYQEKIAAMDGELTGLRAWRLAQSDAARLLNADVLRLTHFALRQASVMTMGALLKGAPRLRSEEEMTDVAEAEYEKFLLDVQGLNLPELSDQLRRAQVDADDFVRNKSQLAKGMNRPIFCALGN
jgi:hypothetical protein